jgi:hypothetical protein
MTTQEVFVLKSQVVYKGPDFFGRKSELKFTPRYMKDPSCWLWRAPSDSGNVHEIEPGLVRCERRRIELVNGLGSLNVYEHIGVLRFFGLIGGLEIGGIGWPPYDGRASGLWNVLRPACITEKITLPLYSVSKTVRYEYSTFRGGRRAFTEIGPSRDGKLTLDIMRSFPGLGEYRERFQFPNKALLEKICDVRTLGWPPKAYYVSRFFSAFGWPHHDSVIWSQDHDKQGLLRSIVWHAALDTLGVLSLLCRDGYFVADVVSECSGHEADVGAVALANPYMIRI